MRENSLFCCPICGEPLEREEKLLHCSAGHSFDRAAEGYVHLLPPNKMHSKIPGDNKQMVSSRRAFLETGWYGPFSDRLNLLAVQALQGKRAPVLLDSGCGEGYYTGRLESSLAAAGISPRTAGFDISKFAVKAAAKKYRSVEFAVGSVFAIPMAAGAADCVVSVFAPLVPEEFARVTKPGGVLLLAVPSPRHLYGLKEILYDAPYENECRDTRYPGFSFEDRVPVRGEIRLDTPEMIRNLFAMTPYYWKTPVEGSRRLAECSVLETEIGFDFLVYRRDPE